MDLFNFQEYSGVLKTQLKQETANQSAQNFGQESIAQRTEDTRMSDDEEDDRPRLIEELDWDPAKTPLPDVRPILEFLKCSIC